MNDAAEKQQRTVDGAVMVVVADLKSLGYTRYVVYINRMKRFFTDATLPEELKWKLGMLYAQDNVPGAGSRVGPSYLVTISEELRTILMDDPRSKSQSEGKADTV